jgi:hydrogenase small subunit
MDLTHLEQALASTTGPNVIWLQGASCTGCSVSFLNRMSASAPATAADVLISTINLRYHPQIMALAGQSAVEQAQAAYNSGSYVLVVEGGIPTNFSGAAGWAWTFNGQDVTILDAVKSLATKAKAVVAVGTCAAFGGISAAAPNPAGVKSVQAATGVATLNIAGCPTHPDWIVWAISQLILGNSIAKDSNGRPTALYGRTVHSQCPRSDDYPGGGSLGTTDCLRHLGCRGPESHAPCPSTRWNNGTNWCIGANAPCIGCTEPTFSGAQSFYATNLSGGGD